MGVEREGLMPFLEGYLNAKKGPRPKGRTPLMVKRWVTCLRCWSAASWMGGCMGYGKTVVRLLMGRIRPG